MFSFVVQGVKEQDSITNKLILSMDYKGISWNYYLVTKFGHLGLVVSWKREKQRSDIVSELRKTKT